ncbi:putative transporter [Venturia nashicola]|uniref:Putative transporter n=1 Tax=Venturia nashicola TaxID=86259 RepID=A0A4Z1PDZ7_9PEZI|nr:putative transporter [Venturia nashicola]TLD38915.1 putative transporter [Venturia nashicola]
MRLFLLPISTRRTLIYCDKNTIQNAAANLAPGQKPPILDRITTKAADTWADFEKAESGWKKHLTNYGNMVLRRIPYEEWGLKSIPALSRTRRGELEEAAAKGAKEKVEVLFPGAYLKEGRVLETLKNLATERQALHKSKMLWSFGIAPFTAPFMLVPVVPNIPFFYMVFRGWSHWRALNGSRHLEFLTKNPIILSPKTSPILDNLYTAGLLHPTRAESREASSPTPEQISRVSELIETKGNKGEKNVMILQRWSGKLLAEEFKLPEMEVEIERAVEQVEAAISKAEEAKIEKDRADIAEADEKEADAKVKIAKAAEDVKNSGTGLKEKI